MLFKMKKLPFGGKFTQKHSICYYKRENMLSSNEIMMRKIDIE